MTSMLGKLGNLFYISVAIIIDDLAIRVAIEAQQHLFATYFLVMGLLNWKNAQYQ